MEWTVTVTSEDFSTDAAVLQDRRDELVSRLQPLGLQDLLGFAADGAVGVVFSVPTTSPHESFAPDTLPVYSEGRGSPPRYGPPSRCVLWDAELQPGARGEATCEGMTSPGDAG
jgi:hypothetical protein